MTIPRHLLPTAFSRRRLLGLAGAGALALTTGWRRADAAEEAAPAAAAKAEVAYGVCGGMGNAAMIKAAGGDYIEESVQGLLIPDKDDATFAAKLPSILASAIPVKACNSFLPGKLKSVGPDAAIDAIIAFADIAFKRAKLAGITTITYGSGASRQIPKDFPLAQAQEQFTTILKRMGPLAQAQGVTVSVEPLRAAECNFLNRVGEVAAVVGAADHPNVRITADVYHMAIGGDVGEDLEKAYPLLHHFHIAEVAKRALPGVAGDDFKGWFRVLAKHGWKGRMSIEAGGGGDQAAYTKAFAYLRGQAKECGI